MPAITALLMTLLAHGVADFIFQTDTMIARKKQGRWLGYLTHGLTIFIVLILFLIGYRWETILLYSLCISLLHVGIDLLKQLISNKKELKLIGFLLDQGLHFVAIGAIWQFFQFKLMPATDINAFFNMLLIPETISVFNETFPKADFTGMRLLISLIVYVYICWGGGFFVKNCLAMLQPSQKANCPAENKPPEHIGFWIGVLERLLILTLVINNALAAVAFIFTAKSIARFNELNDKVFAEYYLIGTLLSTMLAVFGGFLLNGLVACLI